MRTGFEKSLDRKRKLKADESAGMVADSLDVRKAIMVRVHAGEITLAQAQDELKRIKRDAKKNGQVTRNQSWLAG